MKLRAWAARFMNPVNQLCLLGGALLKSTLNVLQEFAIDMPLWLSLPLNTAGFALVVIGIFYRAPQGRLAVMSNEVGSHMSLWVLAVPISVLSCCVFLVFFREWMGWTVQQSNVICLWLMISGLFGMSVWGIWRSHALSDNRPEG
jgi:hypothetical protein